MPQLAYTSIAPSGKVRKGTQKTSSVAELEELLGDAGEILLEAQEVGRGRRARASSVPVSELIEFTNQLVMLYESSVPLASGLLDIADEVNHSYFKQVIGHLHELVSEGNSLSDAMSKYPRIFSDSYVAVVVSGQESGKLGVVLDRMTKSMEWRRETMATIRSALIYPTLLMTAITGLLVLVVTFLIPRLAKVFVEAGVELPALTRALLACSDFVTTFWIPIVGFVAIAVGTPIVMLKTERGRLVIHAALLKLPIFGRMIRMGATAAFADLLGLLVGAGVPIVRALEICRDATRNSAMRRAIGSIGEKVLDGRQLTDALRQCQLFPPLLIRMVNIGEQSGRTVDALEKVGAHYDKEIPRQVKRFVRLMEPMITIVGGGAVALAVFSGFLPILKLMSTLRGG